MDAAIDPTVKQTAKERRAIADLLHAVRRLPKGITLEVTEEGLIVRKTVMPGHAANVALLARKTLHF